MSQTIIIRSPGTLSAPKGERVLPALPITPELRFHADLYATTADNTPLGSIAPYGKPSRTAPVTGDVRVSSVGGNKVFLLANDSKAEVASYAFAKERTVAALAYFPGVPTATSQIVRTYGSGEASIAVQGSQFLAYGNSSMAITSAAVTMAGWHCIVAGFKEGGGAYLVVDGVLLQPTTNYVATGALAMFAMQGGKLGGAGLRQAILARLVDTATALSLSTAMLADKK